jgi:hypothetical protein
MAKRILKELREHAPFTFAGSAAGILFMLFFQNLPHRVSYNAFYILHPSHVFLSALVTASIFKLHTCGRVGGKCLKGKCNFLILLAIGYAGSIGIATLSDSLIPYAGEFLLNMPDRHVHLGFIEKWWLVNPLALAGIAIAYFKPSTKIPHLGHVLVSTFSSLFHILMAQGKTLTAGTSLVILIFLFLAVLIPCCTSDIIFPMLFVKTANPVTPD